MYNTCFWALVLQGGRTVQEANKELSVSSLALPNRCTLDQLQRVAANPHPLPPQGTVSSQKQELLYSQFGINYNNLDPMFRKGSTLVWQDEAPPPPAEQERDVRWLAFRWRRERETKADPFLRLALGCARRLRRTTRRSCLVRWRCRGSLVSSCGRRRRSRRSRSGAW